jgi:hypothetical protein
MTDTDPDELEPEHSLRHVRILECRRCGVALVSRRGALTHPLALSFYGQHLGHGLTIEYTDGQTSEHPPIPRDAV